jgi:hypothetical protein
MGHSSKAVHSNILIRELRGFAILSAIKDFILLLIIMLGTVRKMMLKCLTYFLNAVG